MVKDRYQFGVARTKKKREETPVGKPSRGRKLTEVSEKKGKGVPQSVEGKRGCT